ncbi:HelD family protein [Actinoplanes couchii]|uniref:DNA helicase n=1 Tax=Actinoplanes couchii TaxID=403638 RepID=A0ABQ3XS82_9ACTN|nr:ATP-binding domain-containing protein [Actinoplanes couchii]MDR6317956.1 hypothetical protein [Actinoplanes couchii]GID61366.1 DNA helicase [Actinoplanes couchii]
MLSLADELDYLRRVRAAQNWMLDHARMRVATGEQIAGDRYTAETLGRMLKSHAKELASSPEAPPYFGRMDHDGHQYYIGRRRITDATGTALVIDWRAPVSSRFYRAGARDRLGVTARRRYGWILPLPTTPTGSTPPATPTGSALPAMPSGSLPPATLTGSALSATPTGFALSATLTGFEDEDLLSFGEPGRLLAEEIERPRVGPMRDIVATIQPDQDELVRTSLNRSLCVQGGPGTGKTAVGLHRAAYLLYTYREQLKRNGVLIIGPNPAFLNYIAAVLPALGELDVRQRTLTGLLGTPRAPDDPAADLIKHDPRMAAVLARAVRATVRPPTGDLVVPDGSVRLRIPESDLIRMVDKIRSEDPLHGLGRERLRARVTALLARRIESRGESTGYAWTQRISRCAPVRALLDQAWPKICPADLLADLLSDTTTLATAAAGILTPAEQVTIRHRRRSRRWSAADLVLLDEIAGLLDHPEPFGHIVVDEAQDLSPMECRVIARRSRHGSLTILGDLAQGTTPWAARDWPAHLSHLGHPEAPTIALTRGFRVPAEVLNYANRLLPSLGVRVPETTSFRTDGSLTIDAHPDVPAAVRSALTHEGSIAVIATAPRLQTVITELTAAGLQPAITEPTATGPQPPNTKPTATGPQPVSAGLTAADPQPANTEPNAAGLAPVTLDPGPDPSPVAPRVTALPAHLAKGLEFDHVIVVNPQEITEAEPRGLNRLYVVLTRAVSRLDVLTGVSPPE